jgi:glycosyltransferase involved in cell wall biosynthesis
MTSRSLLSVVVPIYGCAATIEELCKRVTALENLDLAIEIILVDDSSVDGGRELLATIATHYPQCRSILLPRNFGQHWATSRGILETSGNQVVVMDCDLENKPEDIPNLVAELSDKYLCVLGSSSARGRRSIIRQALRRLYGNLLSRCYQNDLVELGFNSFSFAAFDGQFVRQIVSDNSPYDPISIKILDSGAEIRVIKVTTSPNSSRGSSYSPFENLLLAFKSLILAGKGFQILCVKGLSWLAVMSILSVSALIWFILNTGSSIGSLILALVVATIFTVGAGTVLALLTSIVLSSLNQTRPAVVRQLQSDQGT